VTHPLDALGDAHRRDVLELLRDGGLPVGQIAAAMPISRPAVSRHLRILKDAGLVEERAEGTKRVYELADGGAWVVHTYLESVWGEATARFRLLAENSTPTHPRARR
jgi:DNA-binding transcriptional ArsR family regulator